MNTLLMSLGLVLGKSLVSMGTSLLTENFLKHIVIIVLEKIVKKTDTNADDEFLDALREQWNIPDEKISPTPNNGVK